MARPRLGRRGDQPISARRAPSRGRRSAACFRRRLSMLRQRRGARGDAREGASRGQADALRRPLARPRSGRGAAWRQAGDPAARGQEGETIIDDKVQGKVVFANKDLDDLVLLRSDGNPTYMLAVVVDDHDMGVTHIIRGDDHLTNAARQTQIYQALGWDVPVDGAYSAHSWAGRREALEAPRRARRRRLPRAGLSAGRSAQLSGAARLEPRRQGIFLDRRTDRRIRSSARSAARRRASTSPSSRTSTDIICARRATTNCSRR